MSGDQFFIGADSLRIADERRALWGCLVAAPLTIAVISLIFPSVSFSEFVLLIVGGMVFVSISRGRLLGSSIRIDGRQLPELADVAREVAGRLGVSPPQIFVRDDPFVPIASVGIGEPYALILSSQYYDHLRRGELAFLIGRELGHIAAGHTRLTSLLSASGRENPLVALLFGAWLRRTEYTADRAGLLCCGGIEDAVGAISISTFHAIGRRVDMRVLAEQRAELAAEPVLRLGEWIAAVPFATNRLDALRAFDASSLAANWRTRMVLPGAAPAEPEPEFEKGTVTRRECAAASRRLAALGLDVAILVAILKTPVGLRLTNSAGHLSASGAPGWLRSLLAHGYLSLDPAGMFTMVAFFVYSAILVGVCGQTLGMMIMELRVVTTRYARPTPWQSVWRYCVAIASALTIVVALLGLFLRVHPHDRLSRTRLVRARKAG